jgi:cell division protein FtsQ
LKRERGEFLLKFAAWLIALCLVALPVVALVQGWIGGGRWPLRQLEIEGKFERVGVEQIKSAVAPESEAGFFAVRLERIRGALERLPGVERAEVRKRWPDVLAVRITERVAVAAFGDSRLIDSGGVLFGPFGGAVEEGLPRLEGPAPAAANMLALFRASEVSLKETGLKPVGLLLSERGGIRLTLASGATLELGREQTEQRLARFIAAWSKLPRPANAELVRADLRYANGFAVEWHAVAPPSPPPPPAKPAPVIPESAPAAPTPDQPEHPTA